MQFSKSHVEASLDRRNVLKVMLGFIFYLLAEDLPVLGSCDNSLMPDCATLHLCTDENDLPSWKASHPRAFPWPLPSTGVVWSSESRL